jgi:hypothetical protein
MAAAHCESWAREWTLAGGANGTPLSPRKAWALIGLISGDPPFSERLPGSA